MRCSPLSVEAEALAKPEELFNHNLRFALLVLARHRCQNINWLEARSAALRGLWTAAKAYNPKKAAGARFISFARWHVKKELLETERENRPGLDIPRHVVCSLARRREGEKFDDRKDRALLGLDPVWLDAPPEGPTPPTLFSEAPGPFEALLASDRAALVRLWLDTLAPDEKHVVEALYGLAGGPRQNMREVAEIRGVSYQRIGQIAEKALRKLRALGTLSIDR